MNQLETIKSKGNLLREPPKVKKGAKRIAPMSKKRQREAKIYSAKRKTFLAGHPYCEAWYSIPFSVRMAAFNEYASAMECPRSEEIHHTRKPKQTYFLDESTWLAVCRWSHDWIEDHKKIARQLGLLF